MSNELLAMSQYRIFAYRSLLIACCYTSQVLVLAIDTATPYLVLGLPQAERSIRLERRHAEALWPELEAFLLEAGVKPTDLKAIAVGQGPGSYTGLRVGIAAGLGLGRGLGIKVVGVDTLQAVALRYQGIITVAHTTRNGLCYCGTYEVGEQTCLTLEAPQRAKLSEIKPQGLFILDEPPSGQGLVRLGRQQIENGRVEVTPVYL